MTAPTTINALYEALHQLVSLGHGSDLVLLDTGSGEWGTQVETLIRATTLEDRRQAFILGCDKHTPSHELATLDHDMSYLLEVRCCTCKRSDRPMSSLQPAACIDCVQAWLGGRSSSQEA